MNLQKSGALSDLELLEIEMDLLWGSKAGPELVLARTRNGVRARIAERVPSEVARALGAEIDDNVSQSEDLAAPPPQLERCRVVLEDGLGAAGPAHARVRAQLPARVPRELSDNDGTDHIRQ